MKDELQAVLKDICDFQVPTEEEWYQAAEKSIKGKSVEKLLYTNTPENITLKPLYFERDRIQLPYVNNVPGQAPHMRGTTVLPKKPYPWKITQAVTERTPEAVNEEIVLGMEKGQHGITLRLNSPVIEAKDLNKAKVDETGVLAATMSDFDTMFRGVDGKTTSIHIDTGADALPVFSLWAAAVRQQGWLTDARGSVASDPLGYWVKNGSLPVALETCYDHAFSIIKWCQKENVQVKTVLISSEAYHNGGASAVEEIAYTLAAAVTYVRELQERGLSASEIVQAFQFRLAAGASFFMEIAKFRAVRLLWSNIQAAFGIDETERMMPLQGVTSLRTKARYDSYVNMLRSTTEAFAAAAGGADTIEVTPFDEVFQRPSEFSKRIARNTQIILQEEAHIGRTLDAAGGSYYVEQLTDELAQKAWKLFQDIEAEGGLTASLCAGTPQEQIDSKRKEREELVQKQNRVFVGVNKYADIHEKPVSVKATDDSEQVNQFLEVYKTNKKKEENAPFSKENSIEEAIEAAEKGCLLQDIAIKSGWKQQKESIRTIIQAREPESFEKLRDQALAYQERTGSPLSALLVTLGPLASHKARTDFASGFLQTGGFEIKQTDDIENAEQAGEKAISAEETVIVLCGADSAYEKWAEPIVTFIKESNPNKTVLLAGHLSGEKAEQLSEAGLDGTIHRHSNVYETLSWLHRLKGAEQK